MFNKPQASLSGGRHCLTLNVVEAATAAGPYLRLAEEDNEYPVHRDAGLVATSSGIYQGDVEAFQNVFTLLMSKNILLHQKATV